MNKLEFIWSNLKAIGFFPEIAIVGMGVYFLMRFFLERDKQESIMAILIVNFLGQLYYDMPNTFQDGIGTAFFTIAQMVVAIAGYSLLEALKIIDLIKRFVDKKASDAGVPPPTSPNI